MRTINNPKKHQFKVLVRMRNPKSRVSVEEAVEQTDWVINLMERIGSGVGMAYSCNVSTTGSLSGANFLLMYGFSLQKVLLNTLLQRC